MQELDSRVLSKSLTQGTNHSAAARVLRRGLTLTVFR